MSLLCGLLLEVVDLSTELNVFNEIFFQICLNWADFVDSESGISHYMVSVGTELDSSVTDVVNLTRYESTVNQACLNLDPEFYLHHGQTYYTTVWAFNMGAKQLNVSKTSDGCKCNIVFLHHNSQKFD